MAKLVQIPSEAEMQALIGAGGLDAWRAICAKIDALYDMEREWNDGGKKWKYEYKYRRGGKTLCALYARQDCFGLMIIFGKDEREKAEALRASLSAATLNAYDAAQTYHDGKWVMFAGSIPPDDIAALLAIKRKPNKSPRNA